MRARSRHKRLPAVILGLAVGIAAGLFLALRRQWSAPRVPGSAEESTSGLMPDERITLRIREELELQKIWSPRIDVTTVDGVVYLRGREPDSARGDAILASIRGVPGVLDVVDEMRRD